MDPVTSTFTNLGDLIPRGRDPEKLAIIDLGGESERHVTFAELDRMAMAVARALRARGFARGDRIAILSANRSEYLAAYYGIMRAGLVAVPVNHRFPASTIAFILRDCGAKLVFCDSGTPRAMSAGAAGRELRRRGRGGLRRLPRCRSVRRGHRKARRAGDVPLHVGLDRDAQGRGAVAPEPYLGGRDAARGAGHRVPALSRRRAALSHERARGERVRLRRPRHHRAAAAVHGRGLHRGDRAPPLHLSHGRAADDRDDAA